MVKNPPANAGDLRETWVQSLGWKDPLEEGMATHSRILACRIAQKERSLPGYSSQSRKELDMTEATWHVHSITMN